MWVCIPWQRCCIVSLSIILDYDARWRSLHAIKHGSSRSQIYHRLLITVATSGDTSSNVNAPSTRLWQTLHVYKSSFRSSENVFNRDNKILSFKLTFIHGGAVKFIYEWKTNCHRLPQGFSRSCFEIYVKWTILSSLEPCIFIRWMYLQFTEIKYTLRFEIIKWWIFYLKYILSLVCQNVTRYDIHNLCFLLEIELLLYTYVKMYSVNNNLL